MLMIALYGRSCSGKTTVARMLAKQYNLPVRHCGDVVKVRAEQKKIAIPYLSLDDHRQIDAETVIWVSQQSEIALVEGCFLHRVLASQDVFIIELECDDDERDRRMKSSRGAELAIQGRDAEDRVLEDALYTVPPIPPRLVIDTTHATVEEVSAKVSAGVPVDLEIRKLLG